MTDSATLPRIVKTHRRATLRGPSRGSGARCLHSIAVFHLFGQLCLLSRRLDAPARGRPRKDTEAVSFSSSGVRPERTGTHPGPHRRLQGATTPGAPAQPSGTNAVWSAPGAAAAKSRLVWRSARGGAYWARKYAMQSAAGFSGSGNSAESARRGLRRPTQTVTQ